MRFKIFILSIFISFSAFAQDSVWVVVHTDSATIFNLEKQICDSVCKDQPNTCRWDYIYKNTTEYFLPFYWEDSRMNVIYPIISGYSLRKEDLSTLTKIY